MADKTINVVAKVNTKEAKEGVKVFDELKDKVKDLAREVPGLGQGFSSVSSALGTVRSGASGAAAGLAGLATAGLAAVAAMGALGIAMAFKFNELIDGFADLGAKIGASADQAYFLSTAAKQAGGDIESLVAMGDKLSKAMTKSGDDTKGAGEAFARLGVETQDTSGKLRSTADVAEELIEKWKNSEKTASDYADMQLVLGKNFAAQLPVLEEVIAANKTAQEFYEKGIGITNGATEAASNNEKAQLKLGAVFNSMGSIMVEAIIPAFTALTTWFVNSYTQGGIVAKVFTAIVIASEAVGAAIKIVTGGVILLIEGFSMGVDVLGTFANTMWKVINGDFEGAKNTMNKGLDSIGERSRALAKDLQGLTPKFDGSQIQKLLNGESIINQPQSNIQKPANLNTILFRGAGGGTPNSTGSGKADKPEKEKADDSQAAISRLVDSLQKQTLSQEGVNRVTMVNAEIEKMREENLRKGKKALDDSLVSQARDYAAKIDNINAGKLMTDATKAATKIADNYNDTIMDEIRARTMNARDMRQFQELRKLDARTQEDINRLKERGLWTLERENELLRQNAAARARVVESTKVAKATDDDWLTRGIDGYVKNLGTMQDSLANLTEKGIGQLADGMTELVTGGEFSFRSFAATIVKELAKMAIQFLIIIPILNAFKAAMNASSSGGSFWGTLFSGIAGGASAHGNVFQARHAQGGVMSNGVLGSTPDGGISNEAGQEGVLPLRRNAAGDLGVIVTGGGGGKSVTQINNITVNGAQGSSKEDNQALGRTISDMIDKKWQENNRDAFRPGGVNNKVSLAV